MQRADASGLESITCKSWLAYLKVVVELVLCTMVALLVPLLLPGASGLPVLLMVLVICYGVYRLAEVHSRRLYMDADGLHFWWGVLPWTRRAISIRWDELDRVDFQPNFISSLTRSFTLVVTRRFARQTVIQEVDMHDGTRAAQRAHERRDHHMAMRS